MGTCQVSRPPKEESDRNGLHEENAGLRLQVRTNPRIPIESTGDGPRHRTRRCRAARSAEREFCAAGSAANHRCVLRSASQHQIQDLRFRHHLQTGGRLGGGEVSGLPVTHPKSPTALPQKRLPQRMIRQSEGPSAELVSVSEHGR